MQATPPAFRLDLFHSDILSVIFSVFPTRVRLRVLGIVCHKWRRAVFASLLRWAPSDGNLSLLARMPRLQDLTLPPTASHFPSIDSFPTSLHTLRVPQPLSASSEELQPVLKLRLAHLQVNPTWRFALPLLLISSQCLRSLSIAEKGAQDFYEKLKNVTLPSLTSLELNCRARDVSDFLKRHRTSLRELTVVDTQLSIDVLDLDIPLERLCVTVTGSYLSTFTQMFNRFPRTALAYLEVTVQGVALDGDFKQLAMLRPLPTLKMYGVSATNLIEVEASPLASALVSLALVPTGLITMSAPALDALLPRPLRTTLRSLTVDLRIERLLDWIRMSQLLCSFTLLESLSLHVGTSDKDLAALTEIVRVFVRRCTPRVTAWLHRSVVVPPELLQFATVPCWTRVDVKFYA